MTRIVCVIALMALLGCRHKEPKPSKAVYEAAVATVPARPANLRVAKTTANVPAKGQPETPKKRGMVLVKTAPMHVVCRPHVGAVAKVGPVIARLTDQAQRDALNVVMAQGVLLKGTPGRWRVCLPLSGAGSGATLEPAVAVARLHHKGDYAQLADRRGELEAWLRRQGRMAIQGAPTVLTLFDDPEQHAVGQLRSTLDVPVMEKQ